MGFRMYCDTWNKGFADASNGDNKSPKFFGYIDYIPSSYKLLQDLVNAGKIVPTDPDDLWVFKDYDLLCRAGWTSEFILEDDDFKAFMELLLSNMMDNGYQIRDTYIQFVDELTKLPGKKCIWWC